MVKKIGKTTINQNKNQKKKKRKESKVFLFKSFTVSLYSYSLHSSPFTKCQKISSSLIFFQSNQKFQKFDSTSNHLKESEK